MLNQKENKGRISRNSIISSGITICYSLDCRRVISSLSLRSTSDTNGVHVGIIERRETELISFCTALHTAFVFGAVSLKMEDTSIVRDYSNWQTLISR